MTSAELVPLALPIPERPASRLPKQFEDRIETAVARVEEIGPLNHDRRGLAALAAYLTDKAERDTAWWCERIVERRIGELLGPAETGSHLSAVKGRDLAPEERYWFRLLAEHWDIATEYRPISPRRKPIIDEILRRTRQHSSVEFDDPEGVELHDCRATDLAIDGDADLIVTDPPYGTAGIGCWAELGDIAAKALRPGGLLVTYTGHVDLPIAIPVLLEHLDYVWCAAVVHEDAATAGLRHLRIKVGWKPLLIFGRPPIHIRTWWDDTLTDGRREKNFHGWQQAEAEAAALIEAFTIPGDLIVDPFVGGGTTAAAAVRLGRRFIGCDIDPSALSQTRMRLGAN